MYVIILSNTTKYKKICYHYFVVSQKIYFSFCKVFSGNRNYKVKFIISDKNGTYVQMVAISINAFPSKSHHWLHTLYQSAQFKLSGSVSRHNCEQWTEDNPHIKVEKAVNLPLQLEGNNITMPPFKIIIFSSEFAIISLTVFHFQIFSFVERKFSMTF